MALGAITIESRTVWGNKRVSMGTVVMGDGTATWPSGGFAITPRELGLGSIDFAQFAAGEMDYVYDKANAKIDAYVPANAAHTNVLRVKAIGATPTTAAVRFLAVGYG